METLKPPKKGERRNPTGTNGKKRLYKRLRDAGIDPKEFREMADATMIRTLLMTKKDMEELAKEDMVLMERALMEGALGRNVKALNAFLDIYSRLFGYPRQTTENTHTIAEIPKEFTKEQAKDFIANLNK